ncbi:DNA-directed RNA polymerase I subunit RPA49 [Neosynchiropus ocellatus]
MSTSMAASCSLVCCEEETETEKAAIVRFSNGNVKNAEKLAFSFYKDADETNPRRKRRRILVAETERLVYVGQNYGTGELKCNSLCKYYVGVLNKKTMTMELHNAQMFNMFPVIPGETTQAEKNKDETRSYRDKVDFLIEAFGTTKQKKALSSRRLNRVGNETLQHAVTKAADTVISERGLEVLRQEVAASESQADHLLHLPPCNTDAEKPEDVYDFDDLLSPAEFEALEQAGSKLLSLTPEELQKMKDERNCLSVVAHLENLPTAPEARERMSRCAFYLSLLLKLSRQKSISRKFGLEEGCPRVIQNKILRNFTVESFKNGRVQNMVSSTMQSKLATFCLALLLHMGHMTANLTLLHCDLGMSETKLLEMAKSMGLTLHKTPHKAGEQRRAEHRKASLVLPLVKYDHFKEGRKRKKLS